MIVAVKRTKKRYLLKIISLIVLVGMSSAYYFHMNKNFEEKKKKELESKQALKLQEEKKEKKEKEKKDIETAILTEVEKAVDLIGQMIWNCNCHALLAKTIVSKIHLDGCGGINQLQQ